MNRRMLFKGAAAVSSGLLLADRVRSNGALAQAPSYTAKVIYEFTEFAGERYKVQADGGFQAVSPDGVIAGWDWVDGMLAPVAWDLSGTRTALDTGDIRFARCWPLVAGANGYLAGNLAETEAQDAPSIGVLWSNGRPTRLDAGGGISVSAKAVNGNGVVGGHVDGVATRWVDGTPEQFPVPDGAEGALVLALAENGDGYGCAYDAEGYAGSLFHWEAEGSVEQIALPAEVTANGLEKLYPPVFAGLFGDGGAVLSLSWIDATGFASGSWIYGQGEPQAVASSAEDTYANVGIALSTAEMFGSMDQASGEPTGFTGPARWIDGVPYSLQDGTALPADVTYFRVQGVTTDGVIVASTFVTSNTPYPAYILVLGPSA